MEAIHSATLAEKAAKQEVERIKELSLRAQQEAAAREREFIKQSEVLKKQLIDSEAVSARGISDAADEYNKLSAVLADERLRAERAASQQAAAAHQMQIDAQTRDAA